MAGSLVRASRSVAGALVIAALVVAGCTADDERAATSTPSSPASTASTSESIDVTTTAPPTASSSAAEVETESPPLVDASPAPTATCAETVGEPAEPPSEPLEHIDYTALEGESWWLDYHRPDDTVERRIASYVAGPDGSLIVLEHVAADLPEIGSGVTPQPAVATDLLVRQLSPTGETTTLTALGPSSLAASAVLVAEPDGSTRVVWGRRAADGADGAIEMVTSTIVEPDGTLGAAVDVQAPEGAYRVSASRAGILVASKRDGGVDVDAFGPQGDVLWRDHLAGVSLDGAAGVADDQGVTVIGPEQVHRVTWDGAVSWRAGVDDAIWQVRGSSELHADLPVTASVHRSDWFGPGEPPFRLAFWIQAYPSGMSSVCEIEADGTGHHVPEAHSGPWDGTVGLELVVDGGPRMAERVLTGVGESHDRLMVGFDEYTTGGYGHFMLGPRLTDGAIVLTSERTFLRLAAPAGNGDLSQVPRFGMDDPDLSQNIEDVVPLLLDR